MQTVTQEEAIANLPRLIDEATRRGEEVVVVRNNIAVAKIVPLAQDMTTVIGEPQSRRRAGSALQKGYSFYMAENFDEPLEDFAEYM